MKNVSCFVLGLDFGTESVRALIASSSSGEVASAAASYPNGQILQQLPDSTVKLPSLFALQEPRDWLSSAAKATKAALKKAGLQGSDVVGLGVDFTSCTMLPTLADGTPLCWLDRFRENPYAWPKLWKHHGAQSQTDRINKIATARKETFLLRYGGIIGLEWFFPKILETLENAPGVYDAAEVWLEAGDWFVWQLVGGTVDRIPRSSCQAGYKGMWNAQDGYPSESFLRAVHPGLRSVVREKMPGRLIAPGQAAGELTPSMAKQLGLQVGIPVSAAIIDAHAGVPGAGAAQPGTMVMVMGTSSCHMLNSEKEVLVPGIAGVVKDGILPGFYGYETGQAAVGDSFEWVRRITGQKDFSVIGKQAESIPAGADGLLCLDWFHGCRTPLMDGSLRGAFAGVALHHEPAHLYRAVLEGSAMGVRWIVELLQDGGVDVKRFVATGGLPHHNPLVVQVYADILQQPITVHPSSNGPALGAAILGALAAGLFSSSEAAIRSMSLPKKGEARIFKPTKANRQEYDRLYDRYRTLGKYIQSSNPHRS